jgi:SAM-dependent methyltransferase
MEWWEKYFSNDYLTLYHHDEGESSREVEAVIRMLQLQEKQKILDLACGFGRHSVVFAQKGFDVTGYDLSEGFLKKARELAESLMVGVNWQQGDMRDIKYENEFDAVINMFTAFGFFDREEEDLKVLKGVYQALKPGGQFIMDVLNREFALSNPFPRRWTSENGSYMLEERLFDYFNSRLEISNKLIMKTGEIVNASYSIRLYTLTEILDMFNHVGLVLTDVYGNFDGEIYSAKSPRMILVASKEGEK